MSKFYNKPEDGFNPHYGDIDWRALLLANLAIAETEPIWFDSEDGLDQQCTMENTDIHVNKVSDDMDVVLVRDPRDGQQFSFFRSGIGSETFDAISHGLQEIGGAAVHFTLYPRQDLVEAWLSQNTGDDISGFVPDDWMEI